LTKIKLRLKFHQNTTNDVAVSIRDLHQKKKLKKKRLPTKWICLLMLDLRICR